MSHRLARQLETHEVFNSFVEDADGPAQRVWGDFRDPVTANLLACSADLDLFVCDRTNCIKVINLKALREGRAADTKVRFPSPLVEGISSDIEIV